jgi:hypothetical protein
MNGWEAQLQFCAEMIGRSTNLTSAILFLNVYGVKFMLKITIYIMSQQFITHRTQHTQNLIYLTICPKGVNRFCSRTPVLEYINHLNGDINHLKITDFTRQHKLDQLVKKFTRGLKTLDVFMTNRPCIWKVPTLFTSLVRSDHLAVMVTPQTLAKAERKHVFFRDAREHRKIEMEKRLKEYN